MSGIPATSALDIELPAPVTVDKLEEVVLTPVPTDSNMIDPVESWIGPEDDKYIPDGAISPAEDEIMGLGALVDAELINGNAMDGSTSVHSQEIPVFSQELILEDNTPASSAISNDNLSQIQPSQSQRVPTSEPQQLREGQLDLEILSADKPLLQPTTTAGQKRSANGDIRRSSSSSSSRSSTPQNGTSTPLKDGRDPKRHFNSNKHGGHTRNMSAISTASSIMSPRELTNELKTRLSYAMVKVQKGWESLPIYDLESMASQSGSPSSSSGLTLNERRTSAFGSAFTSPRVALARDQSGLSEPGDGGKNSIMRDPPAVPEGANGGSNGFSRTYESFWRSQAQRTLTSPSNAQHAHLAPPVDMGSAQRPNGYLRRSPSNGRQQRSGLSQSTSGLSTSSRYSASSLQNLPHTPGQKEDMATRITTALINNPSPGAILTPAQNGHTSHPAGSAQAQNKKTQSMQEQDAIETLLFMSSPAGHANPLTFPPPSQTSSQAPSSQSQSQVPQGGPLKTSFSQEALLKAEPCSPDPPRRIRTAPEQSRFYGPDGHFYSSLPNEQLFGTSSERAARRKEAEKSRRRSGGRLTGEEIERLIDSYKGESSDEEVEIPLPMPSKRAPEDSRARGNSEAQVGGAGQAPALGLERQRQVSSGQAERQRVALPAVAGNG